tara:strand:+ start:223 stop:399 length:177 start_codon:yes stop_codon:yes gene_type:complete
MENIFNKWHSKIARQYIQLHAGRTDAKAIKQWTKDTGLSKTNLLRLARKRLAQLRRNI